MSASLWPPWTTAHQASLSFIISQSLLNLMSVKSVMPFKNLILLTPSPPALNLSQHQTIFQWISSSHQVVRVLKLQLQRQSFQWIFRVDVFRIDWFDLLAVQGTLKSLLQCRSSKASILWCSAIFFFNCPPLTSVHDYRKNHSFDCMDLGWQIDVSIF